MIEQRQVEVCGCCGKEWPCPWHESADHEPRTAWETTLAPGQTLDDVAFVIDGYSGPPTARIRVFGPADRDAPPR